MIISGGDFTVFRKAVTTRLAALGRRRAAERVGDTSGGAR
jgi:hypothetical protein